MDSKIPTRWLGRLLLWSALFWAGVLLGFGLAWLGQVKPRPPATEEISHGSVIITFSGTIDGADRFVFTRDAITHAHTRWKNPQNVLLNGEPWDDLSQPPPGWAELGPTLELTKAAILTRQGRDVIALEHTAEGFDLHLVDTLVGAAHYEVTISIPKK